MKLIIIPFLLLFSTSFAQTIKNPSNFYFPPMNFIQEKVFHYRNQIDTAEVAIWKIKTIISGKDTTLQTTILNNENITETMLEKIQMGNSQILTYTLFRNDKSSSCTITDSFVYKLKQKIGERIKWLATFQDFNSPNTVTISKIREFESIDDKNQTFLDQLNINVIGAPNNYQYNIKSVYEIGIGLVSYKITRPDGQIKDFKLDSVK